MSIRVFDPRGCTSLGTIRFSRVLCAATIVIMSAFATHSASLKSASVFRTFRGIRGSVSTLVHADSVEVLPHFG